MKKYLLKSMLLVAFVAFSNLTFAQTDVTLHVIDTSKTLTAVKAKGAFNDWTLVDLSKTENTEANDFSVTIQVTDDGDYEWGAIQDDGSENGIWLPSLAGFGSNPSFNVTGGVVSGDTSIEMAVLGPVDVVVAVDMSFELSKGGFDVTTDSVGISGNFNDSLYTKLEKGATDSVYTGTVQWGNYLDYKFRKNEEWEEVDPNRGVFLDGDTDPVELDTVWYSNISPGDTVSVTFEVNMNCHINLEAFEIGVTCLDVNMDGYPPVEMTHQDTGVYAVTITRFNIGDTLAYTYRLGCSFEGDYVEYPGVDSNRVYIVVDGENSTGVELYQDDILTSACPYDSTTSVKNVYAEIIQIYPNPVYNELRIVSEFEIQSIDLYNITGQKVMTEAVINEFTHYMNTETLGQGIYLISVNGVNGEKSISKIIKNK